jgi:phosphate-selective porin
MTGGGLAIVLAGALMQLSAPSDPPPPGPAGAPAPPGAADSDGRAPVEARAAFGEGLSLRPPDDNFGLELRARIQLRGTVTAAPDEDDEEDRLGASAVVRRARITIGGHAFAKAITFNIQLGMSPLDVEPDLPIIVRDAYMTFHASPAFNLRVGQMKVPFNRQRVNSSSSLQFVDRSLVNNELNLDRDVGLHAYATDLFGTGGRLTYSLGLFAGEGRNRVLPDPGLLVAGKLRLAPFGKLNELVEADLERAPEPRLAVGLAAAFNGRSKRERSTIGGFFEGDDAHADYFHACLDALFLWRGVSFAGEVIARSAINVSGGAPTRSALGAFVQGGYMLTDHVELVARAGRIEPLTRELAAAPSTVTASTELAGGASAYLLGHDLKVQSDVTWEPDLQTPALSWRVQTQLWF